MEKQTAARLDTPTVFLVALEPEVGRICDAYFSQGMMKVVALRNVQMALLRFSEVMPVLVAIPAELAPHDRASVQEHAAAVGAVLVAISRTASEPAVRAELKAGLGRVGSRQ